MEVDKYAPFLQVVLNAVAAQNYTKAQMDIFVHIAKDAVKLKLYRKIVDEWKAKHEVCSGAAGKVCDVDRSRHAYNYTAPPSLPFLQGEYARIVVSETENIVQAQAEVLAAALESGADYYLQMDSMAWLNDTQAIRHLMMLVGFEMSCGVVHKLCGISI